MLTGYKLFRLKLEHELDRPALLQAASAIKTILPPVVGPTWAPPFVETQTCSRTAAD